MISGKVRCKIIGFLASASCIAAIKLWEKLRVFTCKKFGNGCKMQEYPGGAARGLRRAMNLKLIREIGRTQRLDILTALRRYGSMTVKELSAGFRMSYMGIKQHCIDLEKDGYLDTWRRPSPVGRPEMLYRLTGKAEKLFASETNGLTLGVLDAVQQTYGPAAPPKILFGIFGQQAERYRAKVRGGTLEERAASLAKLRDEEGYMAELDRDEAGDGSTSPAGALRIVEFYSPIEDLLRRFPIVARLERELFERVLGCRVQREEAEAKPGRYRCTFFLG